MLKPNEKIGDPEAEAHVNRMLPGLIGTLQEKLNDQIRQVLKTVFEDPVILTQFHGGIRHTAMVGKVAQRLLEELRLQVKLGLMTIGNIKPPSYIVPILKKIAVTSGCMEGEIIEQEESCSYDLRAKGRPEARQAAIDLFNEHYGFSSQPDLKEKLYRNSILFAGGMVGLDFFAQSMIERSKNLQLRNRFISPDNSFDSWKKIVEGACKEGHSESSEISTRGENRHHLTAEDVLAFYDNDREVRHNSWCITPVGNPSGTEMTSEQLQTVCEAIVEKDPNAVILLDCTYVRVLSPEVAQALMRGILNNAKVMKQVLFLDSFSKSYALPGARLGIFFSENNDLIENPLQNKIMSKTAGTPISVSTHIMALAQTSPETRRKFQTMYELWAKEKQGLYWYFKRFPRLFEENQPHLDENTLAKPNAPYLFLKLKEGITVQDVALETLCLGVETKWTSGTYIRFALGEIREPTYSHHTP